jgi:hypothetical protein
VLPVLAPTSNAWPPPIREDESEGRASLVEDREAHHNGVQGENRCPYPPSEHNAAAGEEQKPKDPVRHI